MEQSPVTLKPCLLWIKLGKCSACNWGLPETMNLSALFSGFGISLKALRSLIAGFFWTRTSLCSRFDKVKYNELPNDFIGLKQYLMFVVSF
jgi:hypothetical protein